MIRASTPFREVLVEMVVFGLNFVPKRFEELVKEIGSAAARESGYQRVELERPVREFLSLFAPAVHRRTKHLRYRDAQER